MPANDLTVETPPTMRTRTYTVRFLTPAFLGDAEQNARWRTPPFKHLLREWWRVAYAAEKNFDVNVAKMRREEGELFGNAWLKGDFSKSLVRLWLGLPNGSHDENIWGRGSQTGVKPLSTDLSTSYAWFGLVKRGQGLPDRTALKANDPKESERVLRLAFPAQMDYLDLDQMIRKVMRLIDAFGQLGSRSRGGWGSLSVKGEDLSPLTVDEMRHYARPIGNCLRTDWAMSLATDETGKLLVWESTDHFKTWDEAMKEIAQWRKVVRTALKVQRDLRPALGFAGSGRMPSPLRWKVIPSENRLKVRVFAMPHNFPEESHEKMRNEDLARAWKIVTQKVDGLLPRIR